MKMKDSRSRSTGNLLIQDTSVADRVPFHRSSCKSEGIPGELHPRTRPIIMKDMDADAAAAIYNSNSTVG